MGTCEFGMRLLARVTGEKREVMCVWLQCRRRQVPVPKRKKDRKETKKNFLGRTRKLNEESSVGFWPLSSWLILLFLALWLSHFALRLFYLPQTLPHFTRLLGLSILSPFPIPWDLLHHSSFLLPPLTLWLPLFASCLPRLQ